MGSVRGFPGFGSMTTAVSFQALEKYPVRRQQLKIRVRKAIAAVDRWRRAFLVRESFPEAEFI